MLGPMFDPLLDTLTQSVQSLLCVSSGVFLAGGGIIFAMGRLLRRLSQQNLRIQEFEAQLGAGAGVAGEESEPDNPFMGLT